MALKNRKQDKRNVKFRFIGMYILIGMITGVLNIGFFYLFFPATNLILALFLSGFEVGLIGYLIEMFRWKYYWMKEQAEELKKYKKQFLK